MNLESDIETNNSEVASEREEKSKLEERIRSLKLDLGKLTPTPTTPQNVTQNGWSGFGQTTGQSTGGFGNEFGSPATNQDPFAASSSDPFASSGGQDPFGQSGFGNFGAGSAATPTNAFGAANGWGEFFENRNF